MSIVKANTRAYATTHVASNMMRGFKRLIQGAGLDATAFVARLASTERGIAQFLEGGWLKSATLEVWDPTSTDPVVWRFDFTIDYTYYADGDGTLWVDVDTVSSVIRKAGSYPSRCVYRIVCDLKPGAPTPPGWSVTQFRSTDGLVRHAVGTAIGGGSIGAGLAYWKKASA